MSEHPDDEMPSRATGVILKRRPNGKLVAEDLALTESVIGELTPGELLVRNRFFSVDASLRLRMTPTDSPYLPPYDVGSALDGWAVGDVIASTADGFAPGDAVLHYLGWRDIARVPVAGPAWTAPRPVDPARDLSAYLGALGPTGLTAWAGLTLAAELRAGDVVYVSAGAGAVGSLVVQIAKSRGHRVVASAGSPAKVEHLTAVLGADAAFDYHEGVAEGLARVAPDGIDVYFDNVGGSHLDAALDAMREGGRIALCGAISDYETPDGVRAGVTRLFAATERGLTLRGFLARMYADRWADFDSEMSALLNAGAVTGQDAIHDGLAAAPHALVGLLGGAHIGKTVVRL